MTEYGNAIDFKTTPPTLLNGNKITYGIGRTSSISDLTGNVLLYTSGEKAWNNHHDVILNSENLTTSIGATPLSSIIVPHPGDSELYYIFIANKADDTFDYPEGLHYSVVDMSLNDRQGQVIQKRIELLDKVTSLITVSKHADEKSYWLIAHEWNNNKFFAFRISESGVQDPVVSSIGDIYAGYAWQLKVSPDGTRLAVANHGKCDLFYFDALTGVVSEFQTLGGVGATGVEFSPDSQLFYVSTYLGTILQYDVALQDSAKVVNSGVVVASRLFTEQFGDLQLAFDGKIYAGLMVGQQTDFLSLIDHPNTKGKACNYVQDGLRLSYANIGNLPLTVQTFYRDSPSVKALPACSGQSAELRILSPGYMDSIQWDFGDGKTQTYSRKEGTIVNHIYSQSGDYPIQARKYIGGLDRVLRTTLHISKLPVVNLGSDTVLCLGEQMELDAGIDSVSYRWSSGADGRKIVVKDAGSYKVVVDNGVCTVEDEVLIQYQQSPTVSLGNDRIVCESDSELVVEPCPNCTYQWSTGSQGSSIVVDSTGDYSVKVSNGRCTTTDEVHIGFFQVSNLELSGNLDNPKYGEEIVLNAGGKGATSWKWLLGDGSELTTDMPSISYTYKNEGTYHGRLVASNSAGCDATTAFDITIPLHLFIPNVFTPNNDGFNDNFAIEYNGSSPFAIRIYNRQGKELFSSHTIENAWDGTDVGTGIYYYNVTAGESSYNGCVSLLR